MLDSSSTAFHCSTVQRLCSFYEQVIVGCSSVNKKPQQVQSIPGQQVVISGQLVIGVVSNESTLFQRCCDHVAV